ncbi:hypothetical protein [Pseudoramibacter faecis]|uniref:hypothetical protein n=1 Tax=Pseudoramibacter faecis TaxID=3108534 RepID=UPI002E78E2BF|nr:hypothetical protein [Pseudoramibacter sp. HA2172]
MNWNKFFKIIGICILSLLAVMLVLAIIGFINYQNVPIASPATSARAIKILC